MSKPSQYFLIHSTRQLLSIRALLRTSSFPTLPIRDTPTKLLKHLISRTFTFLLSALLIPHASAPYNAVGTITPSYRHFLALIPNPLLCSTPRSKDFIPLIHSVFHVHFTSSIHWKLRSKIEKNQISLTVLPLISHTLMPIYIPRAPHKFTLTYIHSRLPSFGYPTKLNIPVYTTSPLSQLLVLYHLQIIAGLSCHHLHSAVPALALAFASRTTPSIHSRWNNNGDLTQPCLIPILSGNHSHTYIHIRTHVLLSALNSALFQQFSSIFYTLSICHKPNRSIALSAIQNPQTPSHCLKR